MEHALRISCAIVGAVSVGKSTLTNLLFAKQYSDMKIKRTTALPQVYHEVYNIKNPNLCKGIAFIRENNRKINQEIMNNTQKCNKIRG